MKYCISFPSNGKFFGKIRIFCYHDYNVTINTTAALNILKTRLINPFSRLGQNVLSFGK